jgi:hypothetical protein
MIYGAQGELVVESSSKYGNSCVTGGFSRRAQLYKVTLYVIVSCINHIRWLPYKQESLNVVYGKAIPVIGRGSLSGCEMLRIPHSLDNRLKDGGKVVSPTHQPHFTPKKHYFF